MADTGQGKTIGQHAYLGSRKERVEIPAGLWVQTPGIHGLILSESTDTTTEKTLPFQSVQLVADGTFQGRLRTHTNFKLTVYLTRGNAMTVIGLSPQNLQYPRLRMLRVHLRHHESCPFRSPSKTIQADESPKRNTTAGNGTESAEFFLRHHPE